MEKVSDIHVRVRKKTDGLLVRNRIHVDRLKHGHLRNHPEDLTPPDNMDIIEPAILGVDELAESPNQKDGKEPCDKTDTQPENVFQSHYLEFLLEDQ